MVPEGLVRVGAGDPRVVTKSWTWPRSPKSADSRLAWDEPESGLRFSEVTTCRRRPHRSGLVPVIRRIDRARYQTDLASEQNTGVFRAIQFKELLVMRGIQQPWRAAAAGGVPGQERDGGTRGGCPGKSTLVGGVSLPVRWRAVRTYCPGPISWWKRPAPKEDDTCVPIAIPLSMQLLAHTGVQVHIRWVPEDARVINHMCLDA